MRQRTEENDITISELYPALTPEQQAEAEYYLTRYLEIVQGIFERLETQKFDRV